MMSANIEGLLVNKVLILSEPCATGNIVTLGCCCGLPTPLTLVCGVSPIIALLVHQPAYLASSSITSAGSVHKSRGDNVGAVEELMCVVCVDVT